ncbi:hypothetical protein GZH46_02000 [Fragariocoptes setiger]|uniref:PH domain-containing protein n=1 Tax=Fragariocoptes setiger TaxID=1670756 RepID=A0ABQ7S7T4_9ACAR|nr:hypothetical protein GZH46_02000 [Fragariocoptes setiger]
MVTSLSNVSDACWPSVNMENSILCVGTNQLVKTNDAIIDNSYINKDNDITDSKHSDTETLDSSHKRNETTSGNGSKQIRPNTMIDINANSDSFIVDQSSQGNSIKPDARVGFGQQSNELSVSVKTHIHGQQQEQVYENNNQQLLNHHQQQNQQQQQQAEHKTDNSSPSTLKKGMLWQQIYGRLFNRWKERFFILTDDYLVCFKKSSKVGHSEMGSFLYKTCLVDVENLSWASKKKDGVICLRTVNQPCLVLWSNKGLDNWMYSLKNAIDSSKSRREILVQKSRTLSPSIGKQQAHEQNGTGKSNGNIRCTTYSCPPTPNSELIQEPIRSDSPFEKNFNSSTKQILMSKFRQFHTKLRSSFTPMKRD